MLCQEFLQRFISLDHVVLDIGAGSCEFINNINCRKKLAIDLNPLTKLTAAKNVGVFQESAEKVGKIFRGKIDVAFMSNFLEHLESRDVVYNILKGVYLALKPGGKLLIMQPDIRRVGDEYWDYFDHKIPITEKSLAEAVKSAGFRIIDKRSPFLPYTTRAWWLPMSPGLLKIYLQLRPLQLIFGKQFFLCLIKD